MNKQICILTFSHSEASLCLAKSLALLGYKVDFYFVTDVIKRRGYVAGFDYRRAPKKCGLVQLMEEHIPELQSWISNVDLNVFLFAVPLLRKQTDFLVKYYFRYLGHKLAKKNYDAYNIIGQNNLLIEIHKALKGKNVIQSFHEVGNHMNGMFYTPLIKYVISHQIKTILYSRATYQRFIEHIKSSNHSLVANIPFGKFETLLLYRKNVKIKIPLKKASVTFLFVGYIVPYKGLDILCSSMKRLQDIQEKYNLIIAGAGIVPELNELSKYPNVYIINRYLDNDEMLSLIDSASCVVMPYKSASQSGIIPTVFMMGKPIIATNVGAIGESVIDMKNGLLVPPNNPDEFADKMRKVIEDKSLLEKISKGSLTYGHDDEFDWKRISIKTSNFYFN